jgi:DNA-binding transcriptional LysR family regulator
MTVAKASGNRFLLDLALAETPARPRSFCEVRHVMTVVSLVEAGLGIAAVPQLAMPPGDHPTLVSIPLVEPAVTVTHRRIDPAPRDRLVACGSNSCTT